MLTKLDEIVKSICSLDKMERAINEFLPFKTLGPDGIYSVLLSYKKTGRKGMVSSFLNPLNKTIMKSFQMITLTSFPLKCLKVIASSF